MAKGVAKFFSKSNPGILRKMKDLYKARSATTQVSKETADAALKTIDDATQIAGQVSNQITQNLNFGLRSISKTRGALHTIIGDLPSGMGDNVIQYLDEIADVAPKDPQRAVAMLDDLINTVSKNAKSFSAGIDDPAVATNIGTKVNESIFALNSARQSFINAAKQHHLTGQAVSTATSDIKFVDEYLRHSSRTNSKESMYFLANPKNLARMDKIKESPRAEKIITELLRKKKTKLPMSVKMKGLTYTDMAKRMGIGGAVGAGGAAYGVSSLFDWMSDAAGSVFGGSAEESLAALATTTQGSGAGVVKEARVLVSKINQTSAAASQMMSRNPQMAIPQLANAYGQYQAQLKNVIGKWRAVEANTENPEAAKQAKRQLIALAGDLGNRLRDLSSKVGVNIGRPRDPLEEYANIIQIQTYFGLPISGKVDQQTAAKLLGLERKLNQKAQEAGAKQDFTGYFYNPSVKHVISYADLLEATKRLSK